MVNTDGSGSEFLFDPNPEGNYEYGFHADLSPDGTQIVFASCRYPVSLLMELLMKSEAYYLPFARDLFRPQIELLNRDGSWEGSITDDYQIHNFPVWSPDGSRIAYLATSRRNIDTYGWRKEASLFMVEPGGLGTKRLTPRVGELDRNASGRATGKWYLGLVTWPPSWSPYGRRIAFVKYGEDMLESYTADTAKTLFTVAVGGGDLSPIANVTSPGSWSPDGRYIAFGLRVGGYSELNIADIAEHGAAELQHLVSAVDPSDPVVGSGVITHVNWSPDGEDILFVVTRKDDSYLTSGVYVVRFDGSGLRKLLEEERGYSVAAWSPDSSKIAVRMDHEGPGRTFEIIIVERDGTIVRVLERKPILGLK